MESLFCEEESSHVDHGDQIGFSYESQQLKQGTMQNSGIVFKILELRDVRISSCDTI